MSRLTSAAIKQQAFDVGFGLGRSLKSGATPSGHTCTGGFPALGAQTFRSPAPFAV